MLVCPSRAQRTFCTSVDAERSGRARKARKFRDHSGFVAERPARAELAVAGRLGRRIRMILSLRARIALGQNQRSGTRAVSSIAYGAKVAWKLPRCSVADGSHRRFEIGWTRDGISIARFRRITRTSAIATYRARRGDDVSGAWCEEDPGAQFLRIARAS